MMGYTTPYAENSIEFIKEIFSFSEMIASKTMIYSKSKDLIMKMMIIISSFTSWWIKFKGSKNML